MYLHKMEMPQASTRPFCVKELLDLQSFYAAAPDDYNASNISIVFEVDNSPNRTLCVDFVIQSDTIVEETEGFTVVLVSADPAVTIPSLSSVALINIQDSTGMYTRTHVHLPLLCMIN